MASEAAVEPAPALQSARTAHGDPATLLYLIKQLELAIRAQLEDTAEAEALTSSQYTALTVLERRPRLTSAELARNSFVRAQTMAQLTTSLSERGLIRREQDAENKRQYLLSLTEAGQRVLDRLRRPVTEIEERMLAGLDPQQVARFRSILRDCRIALSGRDPH